MRYVIALPIRGNRERRRSLRYIFGRISLCDEVGQIERTHPARRKRRTGFSESGRRYLWRIDKTLSRREVSARIRRDFSVRGFFIGNERQRVSYFRSRVNWIHDVYERENLGELFAGSC